MFTVENALEKGWESSKISRRVYVCNGLIVTAVKGMKLVYCR